MSDELNNVFNDIVDFHSRPSSRLAVVRREFAGWHWSHLITTHMTIKVLQGPAQTSHLSLTILPAGTPASTALIPSLYTYPCIYLHWEFSFLVDLFHLLCYSKTYLLFSPFYSIQY